MIPTHLLVKAATVIEDQRAIIRRLVVAHTEGADLTEQDWADVEAIMATTTTTVSTLRANAGPEVKPWIM